MTAPLLAAADLTVRFGQSGRGLPWRPRRSVLALDAVSVSVAAGGTLGVVGTSGSGKTTLARCLVRLTRPDSGVVRLAGQDVAGLTGAAARDFHRRVQLVPQNWGSALDSRYSVADAITEPALLHGTTTRGGRAGFVTRLLDLVGLPEAYRTRLPHELSGGQAQRVVIARAIGLRPDVLIADEAVTALDASTCAQIVNLLAELRERLGLALVFVSHDLALVAHVADHIVVLHEGAVAETGPAADVLRRPAAAITAELVAAVRVRTGPA
ncbi:dipeptide/oligopeptide/nickel ABC transporter ATP-binding protein [Amycolatopsis sp. NBC_01307]|uniref:ABC transporter ATP-binding protein n=1 Tax=Amycolatopsis sp. NBC_01307 TaxID=2903561 RepID=UPI002E13FC05|nr:dipeptide/oligopeptide/nickel ABC transporter ATP-binding protein [Amycolatopsis sp. NBC_01307]